MLSFSKVILYLTPLTPTPVRRGSKLLAARRQAGLPLVFDAAGGEAVRLAAGFHVACRTAEDQVPAGSGIVLLTTPVDAE
jgi:hypothetical protein